MRRILFILLASIPGLFGKVAAVNPAPGDTTLFRISFEHWEACETGQGPCEMLVFERPPAAVGHKVLLLIPCGGTFSDVRLHRADQDPFEDQPLQSGMVEARDCPPFFDLTDLPDGNYQAYMLGCSLGGGVTFQLKTKPNSHYTSKPMLGLRTTIYNVGDLAAAKDWYSKAFRTEPYFDEPFYVGFNIGGYELGLLPEEAPTTDKTPSVLSYWGVEDIQAAYDHLLSLGAKTHEAPTNVGGELMVATVFDPWGNIVGIIYNPHFKLD